MFELMTIVRIYMSFVQFSIVKDSFIFADGILAQDSDQDMTSLDVYSLILFDLFIRWDYWYLHKRTF